MRANEKRSGQECRGGEVQMELKYCELCGGLWLEKLGEWSRELLKRIVVQEHAAEDFRLREGCARRTTYRQLEEALDELSRILLERGLLERHE